MSAETSLHVVVRGQGERVLFVHGSFGDAEADWMAQGTLAGCFQLLLLDRRGYGRSPAWSAPATSDAARFDAQAEEIATFMGDGAHLVGHSYGGLLCLLVAAQLPELVRSVTVIEPPAYAVVRGHPDVEALVGKLAPVYAAVPMLTPDEFRARTFAAMGFIDAPRPLSALERRNAAATMAEPPGWMARIPLSRLARAPFPKLVVSGNWGGASAASRDITGRACTAVCVTLVERMNAEYALIEGAGHAAQYTGERFNGRLRAFLASAARVIP